MCVELSELVRKEARKRGKEGERDGGRKRRREILTTLSGEPETK